MNAYEDACTVEARGLARLVPYLKRRAKDGELVMFTKGTLAMHMQEVVGDLAYNTPEGIYITVEVKSEEEDKYGNFFLESWSNRNLENDAYNERYGQKTGWMFRQQARLLLYYFLSSDECYAINFFKLRQWAFGHDPAGFRRINKYPERAQNKRQQYNDTWGWCVPIGVIGKEVGFKKVNPLQIELPFEAAS